MVKEVRKAGLVGRGSIYVILPIEWLKKRGIEKGDHLVLEEDYNGGLVINTLENKAAEEDGEDIFGGEE